MGIINLLKAPESVLVLAAATVIISVSLALMKIITLDEATADIMIVTAMIAVTVLSYIPYALYKDYKFARSPARVWNS